MKILILIFLIAFTYQECTKGCLSCQNGKCSFCNRSANYYLDSNSGVCKKSLIKNCQRVIDNHCVRCDPHHFYHTNKQTQQGECLPVTHKVDHCINYRNKEECEQCVSGYHMDKDKNVCNKYSKEIENCQLYYLDNRKQVNCLYCKDGYSLSLDNQSCNKFKSDPNCAIQSNFYCEKCATGFQFTSPHFNDRTNANSNFNWANNIFWSKIEIYKRTSINQCSNIVPDCIKYYSKKVIVASEDDQESVKTVQVCGQCRAGYYLQKQEEIYSCFKAQTIQNCQIYSSRDVCQYCKTGFYVKNNQCISVKEKIGHCKFYKDENDCAICTSWYKKLDESQFQEQQKVIKEFKTILNHLMKGAQRNKDMKKIKLQGQEQWENDLKQKLQVYLQNEIIQKINLDIDFNLIFFTQIENYNQYSTQSQIRDIKLQLENQQNERQYLEEILKEDKIQVIQCQKNSVMFCDIYQAGKCVSCVQTHFLNELNECIEIQKNRYVDYCVDYIGEGVCNECQEGFILYKSKCYRMNPIHNCEQITYSKEGVCLLCKKGYYYDSNEQKCVEFKEMKDKNCLIFDGFDTKNCLMCDNKYFMNNDQKCIPDDTLVMEELMARGDRQTTVL